MSNFFLKCLFFFTNSSTNMYIFIFICIFIKYLNSKLKINFLKKIITITTSLIFLLCWYDYSYAQDFLFFLNDYTINSKELQNGLLLIHPIITYITYCIIFFKKNKINNNFYGFYFLIFSKFFSKFSTLCCISSLILGSVWAIQEIGWGGLWNWDPVEIILLFFFLITIYIIHENKIYFYTYFSMYFYTYLSFYLVVFILTVRLDLFKSIHSFVTFGDSLKFSLFWFFVICSFFVNFWHLSYLFLKTSLNLKHHGLIFLKNSYLVFYIWIYYLIVVYVFSVTINSHYFDYELDDFYFFFVKNIINTVIFVIFL